MGSDKAPNIVSSLAMRGKTLYFGSGADATVCAPVEGKEQCEKFATLPATMVGSLLSTDGGFFAGANGDKARAFTSLTARARPRCSGPTTT